MTIDAEAATTLDPPLAYPGYKSTGSRAPKLAAIVAAPGDAERSGPVFGNAAVDAKEADLTQQTDHPPLGERIIVSGRVLDSDDRPVRDALVEIWQANAAGRYAHQRDDHDAPLDPGFVGAGRCRTAADAPPGRSTSSLSATITSLADRPSSRSARTYVHTQSWTDSSSNGRWASTCAITNR